MVLCLKLSVVLDLFDCECEFKMEEFTEWKETVYKMERRERMFYNGGFLFIFICLILCLQESVHVYMFGCTYTYPHSLAYV